MLKSDLTREGPPIVIERADSPPAKPRATRSLAKPEPMPESATGETMNNQLREELEQHGSRKSHLHTDGLKPCPLCGGRPLLNCYEHGASWSGMWEIECPKCELSLTLHYLLDQAKPKKADSKKFNRELVITRWNRRA